ncbi:hypothetical protein J7L29_07845 [Candidatus Bathyarchaeota archaeon]|nr:hypothetical protein [Candidatus Bathyarchaeota archaeon]
MGREKIGLVLAALAMVLLVQAVPSFAATEVDVGWDTSGSVSISVFADDDAESYFNTEGSYISGKFYAKDANDNPYGYGVDTFDVWAEAEVEGGGYIEFWTVRTDSHGSYGGAGQKRYSFVSSSDWASMKFRDNTNFARLRCSEYGFQSNDQFQASGNYTIFHQLTDSDENGMYVSLEGLGSGKITVMNGEAWGSSWKFGKGCGCYTNAKASATGSGTFVATGWAQNYLKSDLGFELPSGGSFLLSIAFEDGFSIDNFASEGD